MMMDTQPTHDEPAAAATPAEAPTPEAPSPPAATVQTLPPHPGGPADGPGAASVPAAAPPAETPATAANDPPAVVETTFVLKATNNSSVADPTYLNIYPRPLLDATPLPRQVHIPLTRPFPRTGAGMEPTAFSWTATPGTVGLALLAPVAEASAPTIAVTAVPIGATVAVAFADGTYTLTPTPGTPPAIALTVPPNVPLPGFLVVASGPGRILVPWPLGSRSYAVTPDDAAAVDVQFGTPFSFPIPDVSDLSEKFTVIFSGSTTRTASILVGPSNRIEQGKPGF